MSKPDHLKVVEAGGIAPSLPPPDKLIGRVIDNRYQVEAVLGEGGMGLVYRAKHVSLGKSLALKVLKPEVSKDEEVIRRFKQEAQAATAIGNQHIIDIVDFGTLPDSSTYFAMEYLDGKDLTAHIHGAAPLPQARVIHVARQLCRALGAAHEAGIVHRDLKPDNIFLVRRGEDRDFVKVLDFGIAKVGSTTKKLTKAGQVFGTPHYMAPEQCAGAPTDGRTDIYALGVIMYEMATGQVPFNAETLMGILTKHMYEPPLPPSAVDLPDKIDPELEAVILKCMAKDPAARYQQMSELLADLDRLSAGHPPQAVLEGVADSDVFPLSGVSRAGGRPSPVKYIALGLVGLAIAAAVAAVWIPASEDADAGAGVAPREQTPPSSGDVSPPVPAGAASAANPAGAAPVAGRRVLVTTTPPNAEILEGGTFIGNAPYAVRLRGPEKRELVLRLGGHEDRPLSIGPDTADEIRVALRAKAKARPAGARPKSDGRPAAEGPRPPRGGGELIDPYAN